MFFDKNTLTLSFKKLAMAAAITLATTAAQAAPITFAYEGIVNSGVGGPAFSAFIGQTATLEYTFDDAAPDLSPGAASGQYALTSTSVTIGGSVWTVAGGNLFIDDGAMDRNRFNNSGATGPSVGGFGPLGIFLDMDDATGTALSSDALPLTQPDPADFGLTQFGVGFGLGSINVQTFTIADTAVPEPGALIVFGFGLAGLSFIRRRKTA
ncbi:MAG: PEP-CTERM sorting domain-containing protein [Alphaproteobacteria bacterium]|nr:PEP-CTERM sorting domain-containing protein [Alphaproteobacteria bacterium]